jgi:hypothetical protein
MDCEPAFKTVVRLARRNAVFIKTNGRDPASAALTREMITPKDWPR